MPYADPSTPSGVDLKALNGSLLLIEALEHEKAITTVHGDTDAIRCNIAVLDGDDKGEVYSDVLVFPRRLVSQLKHHVKGDKVLGRLGQGEAKPGMSAPWVLNSATDADRKTAEKYEAYVAAKQDTAEDPF